MTPWILIFFVTMANSTTASVKVGFNSQETCVMAARELTVKLKALNVGSDVVWSCVQQ
jgi:propanediol dehydratase large subunit